MQNDALKDFARAMVPMIRRWYADPEHMRQFQEWKEKRDKG